MTDRSGMNVAVTGGAGFIGSHLCEQMLDQGHRVCCIDNFYTGTEQNIAHLRGRDGFQVLRIDVRDASGLEQAFCEHRIGLAYHLAAVVGVKRTLERPREVLDVIINGTQNVLAAAHGAGCRRVVNISSSEVYGEPEELPEREDGRLSPRLPYAVAKLAGEKYAEAFHQENGLETISLRLFNVYGARQNSTPYGFVIGQFISMALAKQAPTVFGDGRQTRDFTYIADCISALLLCARTEAARGDVFNIGTGVPTRIIDLADSVVGLLGVKLRPALVAPRPHDILHRCADISRATGLLGYRPRYSLREGLELTAAWYKGSR